MSATNLQLVRRAIGVSDRHGNPICEGDYVSLARNGTTDDSADLMSTDGVFHESDVYQVYWDDGIKDWSLLLPAEPDSLYQVTYMNHAVRRLHRGDVAVVHPSDETSDEGREKSRSTDN